MEIKFVYVAVDTDNAAIAVSSTEKKIIELCDEYHGATEHYNFSSKRIRNDECDDSVDFIRKIEYIDERGNTDEVFIYIKDIDVL